MSSEDPITEFMLITGAGSEQATQILETVNYNVEEAVNLFFASNDPGPGSSSGFDSGFAAMQDDYVPPPVTSTMQDQLIQEPSRDFPSTQRPADFQAGSMGAHYAAMRSQRQAEEEKPVSTFATGSALEDIFHAPPYCFHGTLEQAKTYSVNESKWLLVNIINSDCFNSQRLNRDTWANDSVAATIQAYFVFWQQYNTTEKGLKFCSLYNVHSYPTCLILDPRTGEALLRWDGFMDHDKMADKLMQFLDRDFSMTSTVDQATGPPAPVAPAFQQASPDVDMNEDPELQQALMASAQDSGRALSEEDELAQAIAASMSESAAPPAPAPPPPQEWTPSVDLAACVFDEGGDGRGRIMLQLADSSTHRKHVALTAPAVALYEFVKATLPEAQTRPFQLRYGFPPKPVPEGTEDTMQSAGVQNEKVMMSWS
uniref:UBX domain-containing protein n=1 Tax=Eutreptiella gymnastica TaxID=73025 RepID=A0A7S1N5L7_9EUGL|mmetsp:Transcript_123366/g.213893  ORF Transcript_123366/g.213893 Transcript_123366/m.213893 type:complete len:427 (+) Transcript_123366:89-1369(+)